MMLSAVSKVVREVVRGCPAAGQWQVPLPEKAMPALLGQ